MKRFIIRLVLEFVVIAATAIVSAQLVKHGHPVLGLWMLSLYGVFNLWRLGIERINTEYTKNVKEARMRRLEAAFAAAAVETLWVSDVVESEGLTTYVIDAPGHGRFLVDFPTKKNTTTTDTQASDKD